MIRGILHADIDAFFVSVEQALNPALLGKPVIVGGKPDRRGVVASASYEARAFGIHSAMPLARAYRLCPQAIFLEGNYRHYSEVSDGFMNILADFSPGLEPGGLEEAFLDITGCDIFGTPQQIAVSIKERVKKELNITVSIGIASCKVVAKIASGIGKPDGLVEVPAGQEKTFLAPLPISKLPGVGPKTEQVLKAVDITTIGKLASLSMETAKRLLGDSGMGLYRHANGIDNRKIEMPGDAKSMSRETTLEQDTSDPRLLEAIVDYLSERVGAQLRQQGRQAKSVNIKLRYSDFETITRSRSLESPFNTDDAIFSAARQMVEQAMSAKKKPVRLIGVGVSGFTGESQQLSMFNSNSQRQERLDRAVDRIRARYGFSSVQKGRTLLLRDIFESKDNGYKLQTPSLSQ